jgi:predicted negative regulator of RcsB-dependent stress response
MKKTTKFLAVSIILILSGCGGMGNVQNQQAQALINKATQSLGNCVTANSASKKTAQCAGNFYWDIQAIPVNDYGKPAALGMAKLSCSKPPVRCVSVRANGAYTRCKHKELNS